MTLPAIRFERADLRLAQAIQFISNIYESNPECPDEFDKQGGGLNLLRLSEV